LKNVSDKFSAETELLKIDPLSFFLAGLDGGDDAILDETGTSLGTGLASGEMGSSVENSKRLNRSHRSETETKWLMVFGARVTG
jgi:hypothetical protein